MQKHRTHPHPVPVVQLTTANSEMTTLIQWDESYSVNVEEIDRQHQRLIALYNKLHEAMTRGKGNEILGAIFDELVDYTETHFKDEEGYFYAINYPGTQGHIREHEAFIKRLSELREKFQAGTAFLTVETLAFMRNWLNEHIKGTDKQYMSYFNTKGIF